MTFGKFKLVPLATALASLFGAGTAPTPANATPTSEPQSPLPADAQLKIGPNTLVSTGTDLLGFTITRDASGAVIAQNHHSHASHASHASHYSSR